MATQYTAGITQGQVWSADIANQIGAAWETWTPTVTQGTTTFGTTIFYARYARIQKIVVAVYGLQIASGTGQVGTSLGVSVPITAASSQNQAWGSAWIYDASANTSYGSVATAASTTAATFAGDWSAGTGWGASPSIQFTTSDQIRGFFIYEAA